MPTGILEQAISSLAVAGFFAVAAGYFLFQIIRLFKLMHYGARANAVIIAKTAVSNGYAGKFASSHNFGIEYQFEVDGKIYRKKQQNLRKPDFEAYSEGQQINILYSAANPDNNYLESKIRSQNIANQLLFAGCCYIVYRYVASLNI